MPYRKDPPAKDGLYHVFTKSIASFKIFNNHNDFQRIVGLLKYYRDGQECSSFSSFSREVKTQKRKPKKISTFKEIKKPVALICYCIMPTHIHLILKQESENGISIFMNRILCGYTHYFNIKYNRRGPLWEGRFKNVLVKSDEQLLHLTRYIHLNPATAHLVEKPEDWHASSYKEYVGLTSEDKICEFRDILEINPLEYKEFVNDRIFYQRDLAKISKIIYE
jgi:putative transposase